MKMDERGVYITLLSYCWNENGLPNSQGELKGLCDNPENWRKIWRKVGKCFYEKKGKLQNKRLDEERKKQKAWRKKSKIGGIRSGEARREKSKLKGGLRVVQRPLNTSSSFPSSSSSSSAKKIKEEEGRPSTPSPKPLIFFNFKTQEWENITDKDLERWQKTYPACDVKQELLKMADWLLSHPAKKKKNYKAFISRWLSNQQDRGGTKGLKKESWADRKKRELEAKKEAR